MDITSATTNDTNFVPDKVGNTCQKLFQDFLEEWQEGDELKYLKQARELVKPEKSTLVVSLTDVERFNSTLAQMICDEYYRVYPFVCAALKNYVNDRADITIEKVIFFFKFSSKNLVLVNRNSIK